MTSPAAHPAPTRPQPTLRPRWKWLHRWLGLGLGLWFVLVGLTGALLVWRDALDAWMNPELFGAALPKDGSTALDLDTLLEQARTEHGLGRIERIRLPAAPGQALRLTVRTSSSRVEAGRAEAFIDPASGALLGQRSLEPRSLAPPHLLRTLYEFHRNVLLGEPGSNIVGVAGLLLLGSAISGSVLAWPRSAGPAWRRWARLFSVRWRANAARLCLDVHRSAAAAIVVFLLLSTATGFTLVYLTYVRDIVGRISPVQPIPVLPFRTYAGEQRLLSLGELAQHAQARYPARRITEIHLTERGLNGVLFKMHARGDEQASGDTLAWLHPASAELLAERSDRTRSGGEGFMHWLLPLHVGSAFGTPGLVAMSLAGIAPLLLLPTGAWLWWRKRRGPRETA
jgi:uncharacterized iron-regulated membrane protein